MDQLKFPVGKSIVLIKKKAGLISKINNSAIHDNCIKIVSI